MPPAIVLATPVSVKALSGAFLSPSPHRGRPTCTACGQGKTGKRSYTPTTRTSVACARQGQTSPRASRARAYGETFACPSSNCSGRRHGHRGRSARTPARARSSRSTRRAASASAATCTCRCRAMPRTTSARTSARARSSRPGCARAAKGAMQMPCDTANNMVILFEALRAGRLLSKMSVALSCGHGLGAKLWLHGMWLELFLCGGMDIVEEVDDSGAPSGCTCDGAVMHFNKNTNSASCCGNTCVCGHTINGGSFSSVSFWRRTTLLSWRTQCTSSCA